MPINLFPRRPADASALPNHRTIVTAAFIAGVTGLTLAACTTGTGGATATAPPTSKFGHVHGLGVDTDSAQMYAATHNGVWLLPTGKLPANFPVTEPSASDAPQLIAGRAQDTMGFVVGRPGLLLGSGHPDPAEQSPPNLGLITSTDGANTWESISLSGETDFHDLATSELPDGELRIYGYDATAATVKISDDTGRTWATGQKLELRDLAADAANPDRVYATTAEGLMVSDNAGTSFAPLDGAPSLYLIDVAPEGGRIAGIDTEGNIWSSDGTSWMKGGGTVGVPEALAYVGGGGENDWLLIADKRGVVATDDLGTSATVLTATESE